MKSKNDEREEESIKTGEKKETKAQKETKTKKETKAKNETKTKKETKAQKKVSTIPKIELKTQKTASTKKKTETKNQKPSTTTKRADTVKKDVPKIEKKVSNVKKEEPKVQEYTETISGKNIGRRVASKPFRMIWNLIVKILMLIILFISIVIVVQKVTNNQESFLGFRIFRVQTGSMIPKYQIGDVIIVKETDPDKIKIGDDVTYEGKAGSMNGLLVTHRVVDIEEVDGKKVFHTKGIANNQEDPVVGEDQINGVVQTKMYILSWICMLLNNKYVFYFCGILPLTIYVAFRIFKGKKVKRAERENE